MTIARALLLAALISLAAPAEAQAPSEGQEAVLVTLGVLGAVGVLTSGIAALAYAHNGKAFDSGWIVVALFSSAFSVATSVNLMVSDTSYGPALGVALGAASLWPLGYSVRSALSPGGFGAPLSGGSMVVPILALEL